MEHKFICGKEGGHIAWMDDDGHLYLKELFPTDDIREELVDAIKFHALLVGDDVSRIDDVVTNDIVEFCINNLLPFSLRTVVEGCKLNNEYYVYNY